MEKYKQHIYGIHLAFLEDEIIHQQQETELQRKRLHAAEDKLKNIVNRAEDIRELLKEAVGVEQ